ncbi:MAG: 3-oxoacyl-ACP synthase III [Myxococcota bacterium]
MRFDQVGVAGVAHVTPPVEVSSEAIEDRLAPAYERAGLVPGRLAMMSGVEARRFWPGPVRPSVIAAEAGEKVLQQADVDREAVGAVVFCGVCRDQLEPATANAVHAALGLSSEALVFDLSNACLGVMNGMALVANLIHSRQIQSALVLAGEDGRPLVEQTVDRLVADETLSRKTIKKDFASLTIGSGAAAVLLRRRESGDPQLVGEVHGAATEHHVLCVGGEAGESELSMATDAEALLEAGLELAAGTWDRFASTFGGDWDRIVTHQVGRAHHHRLLDCLGLDGERAATSYQSHGNVGSVSVPLTWSLASQQGFVAKNHRLALLGIGSGLNCMMMGVEP